MEKARYIFGDSFGDTSVLQLGEERITDPEPHEIIVEQSAVGINFIDILARRGDLGGVSPFRLGLEAAGRVVATGGAVEDFAPGDRITYAGGIAGSYADLRLVDAARAVRLPDWLAEEEAAAIFFKALTADYLVYRLQTLAAGDTVLFHGAAGGVGSLAVPLLKHLGVRVIGAVGREEKAAHAEALGCDAVLVTGRNDIAARVMEITEGKGVKVAYDSVGRTTFDQSLASLSRFGLLVSFGWASGEVDPVELARLRAQGSVFLTRPTVSHYVEDRDSLVAASGRVFQALEQNVYRPVTAARLPLEEAAAAHELLETGAAKGSVILAMTA